MVRAADLVTLPGMKKAPKKRIAAILEPTEEVLEKGEGVDTLEESEEENSSDTEELGKFCTVHFSYYLFIFIHGI